MSRAWLVPLVASIVLAAPSARAATEARRFAVVIGANRGSPDRVLLRYAISDAERFAGVLTRMGGVAAGDLVVLREPSRQAILGTLAATREQATRARAQVAHTEVVVYYSGHADASGLRLGRETLAYRELKEAMDGMGTDVGIAVLDACGSGVITRLKGGVQQPGFLMDESSNMKGRAFLTSSSENEAAQESEALRASYFTHALVSGLRGAADASGDGKVTLGEAYQFAFQETLAQTTTTPAGAQHPALDIRMAGTGDVIMTDVRRNTSTLVLGPEFDGRFYVKNARRHLVAELYKPAGRTVELGLEPGRYAVELLQEPRLMAASVAIADGEHLTLDQRAFRDVPLSPGVRRGSGPVGPAAGPQGPSGTTRTELGGGLAGGMGPSGYAFGGGLSHWLEEDWALEVRAIAGASSDMGTYSMGDTMMTRSGSSMGLLFGTRWYPSSLGPRLRPYAAASLGSVRVSDALNRDRWYLAGYLGGGIDVRVSTRLWMSARAGTLAREGNRAGLAVEIGLGLDWGGNRTRGETN